MNHEKQVKPMNPLLKNVCAGIALFLIFLLFFLLSFSIEIKSMTGAVSARSVPQAISILGMITSLYLTLKNLFPFMEQRKAGSGEAAPVPRRRWLHMVLSLLLFIGYVALMKTFGFILMSVVYLFLQMVLIAENRSCKHILLLLVISICIPVILYVPFRYGFKLLLPMGTIFE